MCNTHVQRRLRPSSVTGRKDDEEADKPSINTTEMPHETESQKKEKRDVIPFSAALHWDDGSSCRDTKLPRSLCVCVYVYGCVHTQVSEGVTDGGSTVVTLWGHIGDNIRDVTRTRTRTHTNKDNRLQRSVSTHTMTAVVMDEGLSEWGNCSIKLFCFECALSPVANCLLI